MDMECIIATSVQESKSLIKAEMCMKFYDDTKPLYLETDASGIGLRAALLQLRDNTACQKGTAPDNTITFASKSLTSLKWRYSNIECEALGILHGLEKFHHYPQITNLYYLCSKKM